MNSSNILASPANSPQCRGGCRPCCIVLLILLTISYVVSCIVSIGRIVHYHKETLTTLTVTHVCFLAAYFLLICLIFYAYDTLRSSSRSSHNALICMFVVWLIIFGFMVGFLIANMQSGGLDELIGEFCEEKVFHRRCEDETKEIEFYYRWKALIDWVELLILFFCGLVANHWEGCDLSERGPYISPYQPGFGNTSKLIQQQQPPIPYLPFMQQPGAPPFVGMLPPQQLPLTSPQNGGYSDPLVAMPQPPFPPPYQPPRQPPAPPKDDTYPAGMTARDSKTGGGSAYQQMKTIGPPMRQQAASLQQAAWQPILPDGPSG